MQWWIFEQILYQSLCSEINTKNSQTILRPEAKQREAFKNQPPSLVRTPKLANICHQFTRTGQHCTPDCARAAGLPPLTRAEGWAAGPSLTRKITWLHKACNLKRLWPLIMFWSTSFSPASVGGLMLIWDFFCLSALSQTLFYISEMLKKATTTRQEWAYFCCFHLFCV